MSEEHIDAGPAFTPWTDIADAADPPTILNAMGWTEARLINLAQLTSGEEEAMEDLQTACASLDKLGIQLGHYKQFNFGKMDERA